MGKNSKAKPKSPTVTLTRKELADLEKKLSVKAYKQARDDLLVSTEKTLHAVYGCAELNAFVQVMRLAVLGAKDLFGFGKVRLQRLIEYIILQYDCILDDHVTFAELAKEIKDIAGIAVPVLTQEDLAKLMNEELDNHGSILALFKDMKCSNLYELKAGGNNADRKHSNVPGNDGSTEGEADRSGD